MKVGECLIIQARILAANSGLLWCTKRDPATSENAPPEPEGQLGVEDFFASQGGGTPNRRPEEGIRLMIGWTVPTSEVRPQ
jgi:hypothetical protein